MICVGTHAWCSCGGQKIIARSFLLPPLFGFQGLNAGPRAFEKACVPYELLTKI